jgi:hypothetical protein
MTVSLIRFLIFTILLVNAAAVQNKGEKRQRPRAPRTASTPAIKERWFTFTSADKDFVIEFPSKPYRFADIEGPNGTLRNYVLINVSTMFQLSYVDIGFEPKDRDANQFPPKFSREMIDQATQEREATVLRSQLLHINVYELEIIFPRKGDRNLMLHSIERYVIRHGRQYTLTCSSLVPNERLNSVICRKFFDSFRVVAMPQPQ